MEDHPNFSRPTEGFDRDAPSLPLYIIMVESLRRNLEEDRRMGHLPSLMIARGIKEINHSQFVDDTLLLGVASSIIARRFKKTLDHFLSPQEEKLTFPKVRYLDGTS
jgi:hypothetical protein